MSDERPKIAEVVTLYERNLRQVPEMLRALADDIAAGKYGEVSCCAISMLGDKLTVHAYGPDSAGPSAAIVLHAGFNQISESLEQHGRG